MITGMTACGKKADEEGEKKEKEPVQVERDSLIIGHSNFGYEFSPFKPDLQSDQDVVDMTQVYLMTTDREGKIVKNGIDGAERKYNGAKYEYYGPAKLDWSVDEKTNTTTYEIELREDITFSDGEPVTADDVIFTYYVLLDPSYNGSWTLNSYNIVGLDDYQKGARDDDGNRVRNIEGIKRIDDYTVTVTTEGYDASAVYQIFGVPIAPMHYYGNSEKYDYDNNKFGFTKGNIKEIVDPLKAPLGAGPYVYKKHEDGTITFAANDNYYLGEPNVKKVIFKEMEAENFVSAIENGEIDAGEFSGKESILNEVMRLNGEESLNGKWITTLTSSSMLYGYIGMNADLVNVGGKPKSKQSKNLRKALMTIFATYREVAIDEYYGEAASVIEYPILDDSWAAPKKEDKDYSEAYSKNINGNSIYNENMTKQEKYAAAEKAAKSFFSRAGYIYSDSKGKFVKAPEGASLSFTVFIPANGDGNHPCYSLLNKSRKVLDKLGIELIIKDVENDSDFWKRLEDGSLPIWCAARETTIDPDMYSNYHSNNIGEDSSNLNYYHINDKDLDKLIMSARKSEDQLYRKTIYKECMERVRDWGVELPVYQRENYAIFATNRVEAETLVKDPTMYYEWTSEIQNLKRK
ncbi:MAG: ABC transporter substrate-binding protein [Lachnospiraceae bacterium]|nr:ABC transporter substrate-binding protein [Lachnospiraceae bacterium]